MALDRQINLFKVDTTAFMYPEEIDLTKRISASRREKQEFKDTIPNLDALTDAQKSEISRYNSDINGTKKKLLSLLSQNASEPKVRELKPETLTYVDKNGEVRTNLKRVVSMFESTLSRTFEIQTNELTYDIFIVEVYYYDVLKDLILHGFNYNGRHYVYFSSSAGQIRKKKAVFVNEEKYEKHKLKLMCGLTIDTINAKGGMNINKYLAYLALSNSATDLWETVFDKPFDIDKSIVVDDFETNIKTQVDEINYETYEISYGKEMEVPIPHTDGCGMISSEYSKKNFMVRLPFIKGLLGSFDFKKYLLETPGANPEVTDIWGKTYNILNDDIQVIFTKSQLKMWKYYDSWDQYKNYFKKYKCEAGICNMEEDQISNAQINYQMLQTLYDATEEDLIELCMGPNKKIKEVSSSVKNALEFFGVYVNRHDDYKKDWFQKALKIYPELLNDPASKQDLKDLKNSMVRNYKGGHLDVVGKFTFVLPDLYAFCQWLFNGQEVPTGLLKNGEVYCRLYASTEKLDCLRSPHLYIEHAIRKNKCGCKVDEQSLDKWFSTDAIYTSTYDPISKILQFDVDGDRLLVLAQQKIIQMAEKCCEDVYPLYYEMHKAQAVQITKEEIYDGLQHAFTGGNIGPISNNITKIWNSDTITKESKDVVKWLCMETNFTIDYAKTLFKPKRPNEIREIISKYTQKKVPNFFIYAKKKPISKVEAMTNNTVNKISQLIDTNKQQFSSFRNLNHVNYLMFLPDKKDLYSNDELNIIYDKWNKKYGRNLIIDEDNLDKNNISQIVNELKKDLHQVEINDDFIINSLIKYLYQKPSSKKKKLLWYTYGEKIFENLSKNLVGDEFICYWCGTRTKDLNLKCQCNKCVKKETKTLKGNKKVVCQDCGITFEVDAKNNKTKRCDKCQKAYRKLYERRRILNTLNKVNKISLNDNGENDIKEDKLT